ncbi:MAG TPA: hypothetical protein VE987_21600 [Polyangiaceae bacterium]|nr:hypothetical protein [Polyangiaceae bacterium]
MRTLTGLRIAAGIALAALAAATPARADEPPPGAPDAIPGTPRPAGMGLSPDAPPVPPAPGGRAPSFGAPTSDGDWAFRISGRISGAESLGIGRAPGTPPPDYSGTPIHIPAVTQGRLPFFAGAGGSLFLQYGNAVVTAYAAFYANISPPQYQGYYNPGLGPNFGQGYIQITPEPLGDWRLSWRVGAFVDVYAGPGQWGWGIFGPFMGIRGYGETLNAETDLTPDWRLSLTDGVMVNPGVPNNFARGTMYNSYAQLGVSDWLHHAHVGVTYRNLYTLRAHYASAFGADDRQPSVPTGFPSPPHDGRLDIALLEGRVLEDPWGHGQFGVTTGAYNFDHALSVADGIWWGVDYTQGAVDMINKFIGPNSGGNGTMYFVSWEYDTSVARILWYPRSFDGRGPDLSVRVAGTNYWIVRSDDPLYARATGYYLGNELEYRMLPWFSVTMYSYAESRDSNLGRWEVFSLNPGVRFHSDWLSTDSIQFIYSRRFYSAAVDNNAAQPLDRDYFVLGGYFTF